MYSPLILGAKYLKYYLTASNGKGHGVHSPFVFSFITKMLNDDRHFYAYETIENLHLLLLHDQQQPAIEKAGEGSYVAKSNVRSVGDIARSSLKHKKIRQLLFRMADGYAAENILELGASLGITTAYLASAREGSTVVALESDKLVAAVARRNFARLKIGNIDLVEGDLHETVPASIKKMCSIDMVFINAGYLYEPTIHYYHELLPAMHEHSVLIFNDIHCCKEMEQAWDEIRKDTAVTLSIDLFFIGLVFFRKEQKIKQHFVIRF